MDNPHKSPRPASGMGLMVKTIALVVESVACAIFYASLLKALSFEMSEERVAVTEIPGHLRPLLLPIAIYAFPVWGMKSWQYRCRAKIVQGVVSAVSFGMLWAWLLDTRVAEIVYWTVVSGAMLALFAFATDTILFHSSLSKKRREIGE